MARLKLLLALELCLSVALALAIPPLEFPILHREAPRSPFRTPASSPADSIPLKLFVDFGLSLQARIHRSKLRSPNPLLTRFSYLREPVGDFYLPLTVGNPPQEVSFTLDTGSELAWTLCAPCFACNYTLSALPFHFARSSSYKRVPCGTSLCTQSLGFSGGACSNSSAKSCVFQLQYGDGSADLGYISVEDFHFGEVSMPFIFGCAVVDLETVPIPSSGIMGLSAGPFSFTSQLFGRGYAKKFAYCLPDRVYNLNSSGLIRFGDSTFPTKLRYTPLVPPFSPLGDLYYYVGLEGISVGNRLLEIPASSFRPNSLGEGGTILDSGTAITHLSEPIYRALVKAMIEATAQLHPFALSEADADVCYNVSVAASRLPKVPSITFHFQDEVDLELEADSILYPAALDGNNIAVCAAFASSGPSSLGFFNIIGNYQQQNYWIEFDLASSRVGLAKANCALN